MSATLQQQINIINLYDKYVAEGKLANDIAQKEVVMRLQQLEEELSVNNKKNILSKIIPIKSNESVKSIYIWGNVGRGKSLLMDMFFNQVNLKEKQRIHFHSLMLGIHSNIHLLRKKNIENPLEITAISIAKNAKLICLDEFQVTDVADAMILNKLFTSLFAENVVFVITSNRPPEELYMGGLQREKFLDFVKVVREKMDIIELASPNDYRMQQIKSLKSVYLTPINSANKKLFSDTYKELTLHSEITPMTIDVSGRKLNINNSCGGVAYFSFHELCETPLGASDYLAIAEKFDTIFLENIPILSTEKRNEARRFVTLIDVLYDNNVKLICSAESEPANIYNAGDGSFEFQRTVSRLIEMQSEGYLSK
ncbi:MAG: cell division protein ZapE [Pseudomonadota bacterium]